MYLEELKKADNEPGDNGAPPTVPSWLDRDKFNRGRQFFFDNAFSCTIAMLMSVIIGLSVNNLLIPLVFTGQSDTSRKFLKRYFHSTLKYVHLWHFGDVWDYPNGKAHISVMTVRKMHQKVAEDMNKSALKKKPDGKGVFISQYDMALVQSGFMGMLIMYPEILGVEKNVSQLDDYVYFWRGIGYLLGVSDKNNICNGSYSKAYMISKEIENELIIPALKDPPEHFYKMLNAYVDGVQLITRVRIITLEVIVLFTYKSNAKNILKTEVGIIDKMRCYFLSFLFMLVRFCAPFRRKLNKLVRKKEH